MHAPLSSGNIAQLVELRSCNWVIAITGWASNCPTYILITYQFDRLGWKKFLKPNFIEKLSNFLCKTLDAIKFNHFITYYNVISRSF